jgi:hypothetical protein
MSTKITRSAGAGQANANAGHEGFDAGTIAVLKRMDAMEKKYDEKVDEIKKSLNEQMEKLRTDLKADLRSEFLPLIRVNEEDILDKARKINDVETRMDLLEDRLETNEKAADLIVKGVPVHAKEVVANHYCAVARALGYDENRIPPADVFRLGRKLPDSKQDPPILIKFTNKLDKSRFYREYLSKIDNMKLTILGFSAPTRFYIAENLSRRSQAILTEALKLKRAGKLDGASSSFGNIYVRPKNAPRSFPVKDLSSLRKFANNE